MRESVAPPQAAPAFGVALDPYRPLDVLGAPGQATRPPACPVCDALLHVISQNPLGDTLFECLADGWEGVYRVGRSAWEPRPGREDTAWKPPRGWDGAITPTPSEPFTAPTPEPPVAPTEVLTSVERAEEDEWVTLDDAASISGLKPDSIYRRVKRGAIPSRRREKDGRLLVKVDGLLTE